VFSFVRIGAALAMRVEDVCVQYGRPWVRLPETGDKRHEMTRHHAFDAYLPAYFEGAGIGIGTDPKGPLFRTVRAVRRGTGQLSGALLPQANAYAMMRRRASRRWHRHEPPLTILCL
jgi:hypothetical protein